MSEITFDPAVIWLIAGIVLIVAEFIIPGLVIIFFGLAALVVSLLDYTGLVTNTSAQLLLFSAFSLGFLFGLRRFFKDWFVGESEKTGGSDEKSDIIGQDVVCLTAFSPDQPYGKVEFKGANWKGRSEYELKEGAVAVVVAVEGLCLHIKPKD